MWATLIFSGTVALFLASTISALRQGGVRWRDTLYPLAVLRAGNVR